MNEKEKNEVLNFLNSSSKLIENKDLEGLKRISNNVINNDSLFKNAELSFNAVTMYHLSEKFEREGKIDNSILAIIQNIEESLKKKEVYNYDINLEKFYDALNLKKQDYKLHFDKILGNAKKSNGRVDDSKNDINSIKNRIMNSIRSKKKIIGYIFLLAVICTLIFAFYSHKGIINNRLKNAQDINNNSKDFETTLDKNIKEVLSNKSTNSFPNYSDISGSVANPSQEKKSAGEGGAGGEGGGAGAPGAAGGAPAGPANEAQPQITNQTLPEQNNTFENSTTQNNITTNSTTQNNITSPPSQNQTQENSTSPSTPVGCYIENQDQNGLTIFASASCHDSEGVYTNLCASPINQDASNIFIKTFVCINNRCSPKYYSCQVMGETYFARQDYRCVNSVCSVK